MPISKNEILSNYKSFFKLAKKTSTFFKKVITDNKINIQKNNLFSGIQFLAVIRNYQRYKAIIELCKKGLAKDAFILLRALLENLIDLAYIVLDKNNRAKLYVDFDYRFRSQLIVVIKENKLGTFSADKEKEMLETENHWQSIKKNYLINKNVCSNWSCKNRADMAKEAGLKKIYDMVYRYASLYVHNTPTTADNYIKRDIKGGLDDNLKVEIGESEHLVKEVLITASIYYLEIIKIADDNKIYQKKIQKLMDKWGNLKN